MISSKKDFLLITIIGLLVGLLAQPVLTNTLPSLGAKFAVSAMVLRVLAFLVFLIGAPVALWLIEKIVPTLYQFGKFAAVGALNTFLDLGILNLASSLLNAFSGGWAPVLKGISFLCATTNSYFWNRTWTFNAAGKANGREAAEFYVVAIIGFALNVGIYTVFVNYLGHPGISDRLWANAGALVATACTLLWNFFGYKLVVFKPKAVPVAV